MDKSIATLASTVDQNDIRELTFAEILLIAGAGGIEEFPVIPR